MACWLKKSFMQAATTLKVDVDFPRLSILSLDFDWLYPKTRGLILHSYSWQSHVSWYLTLSFSATFPSPVYFISSFLKITNAIIAIIITVTIITIIAIITYYYSYYILLLLLLYHDLASRSLDWLRMSPWLRSAARWQVPPGPVQQLQVASVEQCARGSSLPGRVATNRQTGEIEQPQARWKWPDVSMSYIN